MSAADYQSWMKEENSLIAADRPWERALAIVAGSPVLSHDADREVVMAMCR